LYVLEALPYINRNEKRRRSFGPLGESAELSEALHVSAGVRALKLILEIGERREPNRPAVEQRDQLGESYVAPQMRAASR
jgi:hypothetical protein